MIHLERDMGFNLWHPFDLEVPLYSLYRIRDLKSKDFFDNLPEKYTQDYTGQEIKKHIVALEWAMNNKSYNFKDIHPNIQFPNEEIVLFLEKYLDVLKSFFNQDILIKMNSFPDERELKILLVNHSFPTGYGANVIKYANYQVVEATKTADAIAKYSINRFDIAIVRNNSVDEVMGLLTKTQEINKTRKMIDLPIIILLYPANKVDVKKLYELGCSRHLLLPVPRYLLLQEIYRLTTEK